MALDYRKTMVLLIAVFLFAMFLKTLSEPTSIDGYSVIGEPVDSARMTFEMISLLGAIFTFFVLFLLIVIRRLDHRYF